MKLLFEHREELAPNIWQYFFRPERPVDFTPGQYIDVHLPAVADDPRGKSRTFTITSVPSDALLSFVVKIVEPASRYKRCLANLSPGDEARIDDAMGDLVLPKSRDVPLVYVAGGIGMASYASMLGTLVAAQEARDIYLFYALRSRGEQIFRELADSYPLRLKQLVYAPNRLRAEEIRDATPPDAFIYISGSQRFVEGLRTDLARLGTPHEQIVFDYYDGYVEL